MAAPTFDKLSPALIDESPLNPRRDFDAKALAELAASVAERGVLEPLLVRPVGDRYEVIAGARRLRAAKAVGLKWVPCMVREATDAELLELALLENVVRADINALEEGEAYAKLVKEHAYTADSLAEKTGKSRTVVYSRMKLAQLQGRARDLVLTGGLNASIGELLSRLPTLAAQEEAVDSLEDRLGDRWEDGKRKMTDWSTLAYRHAKEHLDRELSRVVAKAPFDVKDTTLFSVAGACTTCPKRTSQDKAAFPDVKADTCLDSACWATKKGEAAKRVLAKLQEEGLQVLGGGANRVVNFDGSITYSEQKKYVLPSEKMGGSTKTLKQLIPKESLKDVAVVVLNEDGRPHTLIERAKAAKLLKKDAPKVAAAVAKWKDPYAYGSNTDAYKKEAAKRKKEAAADKAVADAVRAAALKQLKGDIFKVMGLVFEAHVEGSWRSDELRDLAGVPADAKKLTDEQRLSLLLVDALEQGPDVVESAAKLVKLDVDALRKVALNPPEADTNAKLKAADKAQAKKPAKAEKKAGKKAA
jgi:ParB family chromosome partitioning protein